jgi:hypothetical protein
MKNLTVYVLKCDTSKYYVGRSLNYGKRIDQHFAGKGAEWTKKYKPIYVDKIIQSSDVYDEDKYTLMYMNKYGIGNVRGGTYSRLILPDYQIKTLKDQLSTIRGICYYCGSFNHFISDCTKMRNKLINK